MLVLAMEFSRSPTTAAEATGPPERQAAGSEAGIADDLLLGAVPLENGTETPDPLAVRRRRPKPSTMPIAWRAE
jgi:hypothetical protein